MSSSLRSYLETLRAFPATALANPQQYFFRPGRDFTRHRSLWLERVVWLTMRYRWVHFGEIYRLRWGIETCFFVIKSYLQLANFSSYTLHNCRQDIYSHFILYNIQTVFNLPLQPHIKRISARRKFDYQANRNASAGLLKRFLIKFFLTAHVSFKEHYVSYSRQIIQSIEPIRPEKNKQRRRRLMRGTERHIHDPSYRRAL